MRLTLTVPAMTSCGGTRNGAWRTTGWIGYYCANKQRPWDKANKRYAAWKDHVWAHVRSQLPQSLLRNAPLDARGWRICTQAYCRTRTHADAENIHKALVDALVGRTRSRRHGTRLFRDDKHLAGAFEACRYDRENPRVVVRIERMPDER